VGSGPFQFGESREAGRVLRYMGTGPNGNPVDLVRFDGAGATPVAALIQGELDAVVGGWLERIPRKKLAALNEDPRFGVTESQGSSVFYMSFSMLGATASAELRRRIAASVDRKSLLEAIEGGYADPCRTWAAPSVQVWPRGAEETRKLLPVTTFKGPLVMLAASGEGHLHDIAQAVSRQLRAAGLSVRVVVKSGAASTKALAAGSYDLRIERTWGVPYDPFISLCARFLPPPEKPSAASQKNFGVDPRLTRLVEEATREVKQDRRSAVYGRIQRLMDREALIVPLFAPRRFAVVRKGCGSITLDHDLYRMDLSNLHARR